MLGEIEETDLCNEEGRRKGKMDYKERKIRKKKGTDCS